MIYKGNLAITSINAQNYKELEEVTGDLYIDSNAELSAPKLESVGGNLSIYSNVIKDFPNNIKIKCLRKICGNIGKMKFESIDGIACAVLSTKSRDRLTIKRCQKSIFKDGRLIGEQFYVASNKNNNAHGKTTREAIQELHFKEASRDVNQYKKMSLETKKKPEEWAMIYRIITGACRFGVDSFMNDRKLKKSYTLKEILNETKGAFGYKRFTEVINDL